MDIQFHGANCITLSTKQARITIDDNLRELGLKTAVKAGDINLYTGAHDVPPHEPKIIIDQPGEYEVSGVSIYGIAARSHMDEEGKRNATMYKLVNEDLRILVTGHIYPELTEAQLESIGMIDVMIVPTGGNGYTLDPVGALKLIKKVEPKLVIPTHYDDKDLTFPVPQQPLEEATKVFAMEVREPVAKLKIKSGDLSEVLTLAPLERV
ncbi:MAG TPA: MBL fold metallo-hydrolase [Candidatus Saccharimonadales bacterium]